MGEKVIIEKMLEDYNDVFADIVNTLLFGGEKIIDPNDLESKSAISNYKADGKVRELERDVVKFWKKYNIRIACIGLENQTVPDPYMILRVAGYDGTEYRSQLNNLGRGETPLSGSNACFVFWLRKTLGSANLFVRGFERSGYSETLCQ